MNLEKSELTIKTIDGARMIINKDGSVLKGVIATKEYQDLEMSEKGYSKVEVTIFCKCE